MSFKAAAKLSYSETRSSSYPSFVISNSVISDCALLSSYTSPGEITVESTSTSNIRIADIGSQ